MGAVWTLKEKWRGKTSSILKSKDISISGNYLVIEKRMCSSKCAVVELPEILFTWQ